MKPCVILLAILTPAFASGASLENNLTSAPDGGFFEVQPSQRDAQGFRTDASDYIVTGGAVKVATHAPPTPVGTPFAQIFTTTPGGLPDVSIGSFTFDPLSPAFGNIALHPVGTINLAANTDYFLVLGDTGASGAAYVWATTAATVNTGSGTVTSGTFTSGDGLAWMAVTPTTRDLMFQLEATPVPEPAPLKLTAMVVVLAGLWGRRRLTRARGVAAFLN